MIVYVQYPAQSMSQYERQSILFISNSFYNDAVVIIFDITIIEILVTVELNTFFNL